MRADGVFFAELNEVLTRELNSGVEVRVTPMRTEIIIRATRTQNVLGSEPFATIHHEDLPQELEQKYRSWLDPQMETILSILQKLVSRVGDRVKYWITINEPNLAAEICYIKGIYPSADCSQRFEI